jgi:hypothetical protein
MLALLYVPPGTRHGPQSSIYFQHHSLFSPLASSLLSNAKLLILLVSSLKQATLKAREYAERDDG